MEKVFPKIRSLVQSYELLPENGRIITDVLGQIVTDNLPAFCKEKYRITFFSFIEKRDLHYLARYSSRRRNKTRCVI